MAPITPDTHHMLQRGGIPVHHFGTMARGLKDATAVESGSHKTWTMCIRSLELPWKSGRCDTDGFSWEEKMRAVTSTGELLPQKQCERRETTPERLASDFHMQILVHNYLHLHRHSYTQMCAYTYLHQLITKFKQYPTHNRYLINIYSTYITLKS